MEDTNVDVHITSTRVIKKPPKTICAFLLVVHADMQIHFKLHRVQRLYCFMFYRAGGGTDRVLFLPVVC